MSKKILVLDIGTASLNALVAEVSPERPPEVLTSLRLGLRLLDRADFKSLWRYVKEALVQVITTLQKDNRRFYPELISVVFSSPWYLSQTRIIRTQRAEMFQVTPGLVQEMISEELELFRKKSQEKFSLSSENITVLEHEVMKTVLNGYAVDHPFKKKTRSLELSLYMSLSRKELLEELQNLLEHYFGRTPLKINSSPLALFRILKDFLDSEEGFILVDVGGEITEISLIHQNIVEEVLTFARGGHFILRRLTSHLGVGLEEALSLLKSKTRGELKDTLDQKVSEVLFTAGKEWFKLFLEAASELGKGRPLPQTLLLTGGASGLESLKAELSSSELSGFTILGRPFNLVSFLPENLETVLRAAGLDKKDPQLTLPLLLVLAAAKNAFGATKN